MLLNCPSRRRCLTCLVPVSEEVIDGARVDTGAADHLDSQRSGIEPMFVKRTVHPVGLARSALCQPIPRPSRRCRDEAGDRMNRMNRMKEHRGFPG